MINVEGQFNSTNSTPQATNRASTSGYAHTTYPTITPKPSIMLNQTLINFEPRCKIPIDHSSNN